MGDQWMTIRQVRVPREDLSLIPPHPNWRYEAVDDERAWIVPKPRFGHALLELSRWRCEGGMFPATFRSWTPEDPNQLVELFTRSFSGQEPLAGLTEADRLAAASQALTEAWAGQEGPVSRSSVVAMDGENPVGAALVTLLPGGDLDAHGAWRWNEAPPEDLEDQAGGQPHLTWIFVERERQHEGIGAAILDFCVRRLKSLGYRSLASTFLTGNHASVLWHWRMGFQLLSWPGSPRWRGKPGR